MLSSVRDIQILRSHRSGKTTLMRGDFRFATALVSKEFHLLFFPDGIQCLWGIVPASSAIFPPLFTVNRGVSQFHQQIKQECIAALTLLETRAEQRQNGSNVLQPAQRFLSATAPDIPDTAAGDPAARGCRAANRAARTGPSDPPSPDHGRGIHRERVRTAAETWHAPGQTAGCSPPAHQEDRAPADRGGKRPASGHPSLSVFR